MECLAIMTVLGLHSFVRKLACICEPFRYNEISWWEFLYGGELRSFPENGICFPCSTIVNCQTLKESLWTHMPLNHRSLFWSYISWSYENLKLVLKTAYFSHLWSSLGRFLENGHWSAWKTFYLLIWGEIFRLLCRQVSAFDANVAFVHPSI